PRSLVPRRRRVEVGRTRCSSTTGARRACPSPAWPTPTTGGRGTVRRPPSPAGGHVSTTHGRVRSIGFPAGGTSPARVRRPDLPLWDRGVLRSGWPPRTARTGVPHGSNEVPRPAGGRGSAPHATSRRRYERCRTRVRRVR